MNDYQEISRISRPAFFSRVLGYLAVGLGLSALGAVLGNWILPLLGERYMFAMLFFMVSELVLAFVIGSKIDRYATSSIRALFIAICSKMDDSMSCVMSSSYSTWLPCSVQMTAVW